MYNWLPRKFQTVCNTPMQQYFHANGYNLLLTEEVW